MKKLLLLTTLSLAFLGIQAQDSTQVTTSDKEVKLHQRGGRKMAKPAKHYRMGAQNRMDSVLQLTDAQKIKLKELQEEYQQKRMAVYTPEQKAKLESFRKKSADRTKRSYSKGPSTLTEDQKSSMKKLREEHRSEAAVIKANEALSAAEKKQKMQALQQAHRQQMQEILTPEQLEQMKKRSRTSKDGPAR